MSCIGKKSDEIKQYKSLLEKASTDLNVKKSEILLKEQEVKEAEKRVKSIQSKINKLKKQIPDELTITDHALLRYIERVMHIDVDKIRNKILSDEIKEKHRVLGNGTYGIENVCKAVIKNNCVVTVVNN